MGLLLFTIFLAYGFTGRATALVNHDLVPFAKMRAAIIKKYGALSYPAIFVRCPWCVSMWFALPAARVVFEVGRDLHLPAASELPVWVFVPGLWFTLSWAVSLTAANLDPEE